MSEQNQTPIRPFVGLGDAHYPREAAGNGEENLR